MRITKGSMSRRRDWHFAALLRATDTELSEPEVRAVAPA
jgi:hypothetical protein